MVKSCHEMTDRYYEAGFAPYDIRDTQEGADKHESVNNPGKCHSR